MQGIIVTHKDERVCNKIKQILTEAGFDVISCINGARTLHEINRFDSGVVITQLHLNDMYALELRNYLPESYDMLLLLSPANQGVDVTEGVVCLSMPLQRRIFLETVHLMLESHINLKKKKQTGPVEKSEEDKMNIEKAKSILMHRHNLSEPQAHTLLQKKSMNSGISIMELAKTILEGVM